MHPIQFPESNTNFGAPSDMDETQVGTLPAFTGQIQTGNIDGAPVIVTAWQPSQADLDRLNAGGSVFLSIMANGLPPHMMTTSFKEAVMKP